VKVRFEAYFEGIREVMQSDEVTGPMREEADGIASRAASAGSLTGAPLTPEVVESVRSDGRPEAQVRAEVDGDAYGPALAVLRKAADV